MQKPPEDSTPPPADARAALRLSLRARRLALPPNALSEANERLLTFLATLISKMPDGPIGFYWALPGEADLCPLLAPLQRVCALPVVTEKNQALAFRRWTPETPMQAGAYGIPVPAQGEWIDPTILLVPLLGFDSRGFRLGYGGGYFDRTLASRQPRPLTIGIGFEFARVDNVQPAAHDIPMDWLVSEAGCFAGARPLP